MMSFGLKDDQGRFVTRAKIEGIDEMEDTKRAVYDFYEALGKLAAVGFRGELIIQVGDDQ